ncbi:deoxyribonuclease-1 isoform X1 [Eulemur rufifrons]|uniref:deoxyribonuclease-1 isoform X1 n=1 Tax=Eulemur rufifrons TaxID=859984 RepID=UPI003743DD1C
MRLLGELLALAGLLQVVPALRIAAFNIQTFGETKMSNATLSNYIVQILSRYDVALVQEVRDSHLTAVGKLLDKLNQDAPDTYHYVVSEPLGRNSYKERYLFVYRPDQVSVLDSYYYDDGCEPCGNDTFSREPAIVKFSSPFTGECCCATPSALQGPSHMLPPALVWWLFLRKMPAPWGTVTHPSPDRVTESGPAGVWTPMHPQASLPEAGPVHRVLGVTTVSSEVREFAIVPLHAAPADAVAEIDALYDVYLDVRQKWDMEDIMLMGDFNAGCSYVTPSHWPSIRLRTNSAFQWLIPDSADTTVTSTHCAYDRIVVSGSVLQGAVVPGSAAPFDFQATYGLSDQLALAISDHYPVEVTLKTG